MSSGLCSLLLGNCMCIDRSDFWTLCLGIVIYKVHASEPCNWFFKKDAQNISHLRFVVLCWATFIDILGHLWPCATWGPWLDTVDGWSRSFCRDSHVYMALSRPRCMQWVSKLVLVAWNGLFICNFYKREWGKQKQELTLYSLLIDLVPGNTLSPLCRGYSSLVWMNIHLFIDRMRPMSYKLLCCSLHLLDTRLSATHHSELSSSKDLHTLPQSSAWVTSKQSYI